MFLHKPGQFLFEYEGMALSANFRELSRKKCRLKFVTLVISVHSIHRARVISLVYLITSILGIICAKIIATNTFHKMLKHVMDSLLPMPSIGLWNVPVNCKQFIIIL